MQGILPARLDFCRNFAIGLGQALPQNRRAVAAVSGRKYVTYVL